MKGDEIAIWLIENNDALKWWMIDGPEIARLLNKYDDKYSSKTK